MNAKLFIHILIFVFLFTSCSNKINKALTELQNMPAPDYHYVVQPVYTNNKESLESIIKELYSAEKVKVGAVGTHGYNNETQEQKDEKYWFQVVLLNSKSIVDFKNESKMDKLGKEVAKSMISEIKNIDRYDKIQITFVEQWNDGTEKQLKQNIFYSLPDLKVTDLFDEK
jgi:uncharacterized iron-regulated protein